MALQCIIELLLFSTAGVAALSFGWNFSGEVHLQKYCVNANY